MNQNGVSLVTKTRVESSFPFLRLPREIRDQIYGYLLATKNNKCIDARRKFYSHDERHSRILFGIVPLLWPTHRFRFHPNLLQTNRQISLEGDMVLYEQNLFVHIMGWNLDVNAVAKAIGLRSVYTLLPGDHNHPTSSMKIFADPTDHILEVYDGVPTSQCLIACDDLETFCQGLSSDMVSDLYKKVSRRMLPNTVIDFTIDSSISGTTAHHRLLDPLRTLHGLRKLRINGSEDSRLCAYVVSQATTDFPDLGKVLAIIRIRLEEGNHAFHHGSLSLAIAKYKEALKYQVGAKRQYLPSVQLMYNVSAAYMKCNDWVRAVQWTFWTLNVANMSTDTEPHKSILKSNSLEMGKMVHRHTLARLQFEPRECARYVGDTPGSSRSPGPHDSDSPDEELLLLKKHLGPPPHMRDPEALEKVLAAVTVWEGPELLESGWDRNWMIC